MAYARFHTIGEIKINPIIEYSVDIYTQTAPTRNMNHTMWNDRHEPDAINAVIIVGNMMNIATGVNDVSMLGPPAPLVITPANSAMTIAKIA
tara:strand:+ start:96378 stop:96653 length:276 start_codon:yes stop_codon:yes gene_type:complete